MRKSTTDRMNDYDAVVMGVLEPILVLSVMAVIGFLVRPILVRGWSSAESAILPSSSF
jgi:hypothetical protein